MKKNTLYLTYNGLIEPLGYSQILPYIYQLNNNYNITIISFEKTKEINSIKSLKNKLSNKFIKWYYFKRFDSISLNIISYFFYFIFIQYIIIKKKIKLIHARSFLPAVIALIIKKIFKIRYIYDIRGFWLEEKIDRLNYRKNIFFNFLKLIDKLIYLNADHIVFLTNESFRIINNNYFNNRLENYTILQTCADKNIFYPQNKKKDYHIKFGYIGTISGAYNFEKVIKYFSEIIKIDRSFKILIINNNEHQLVSHTIKKYNIPKKNYELFSLNRMEINKILNQIDIGIFSVNENFSIKASFPTRIAEFLMCGKPIISNVFNSDIQHLVLQGLIYKTNFNTLDIKNEVIKIKNFLRIKVNNKFIRNYAIDNFSLEIARKRLLKIYNNLL